MAISMYILSVESRGLAYEIRVNDVRQYLRRDGTPTRASARLNPWLRQGGNELKVVGRRAPVPSPSGEDAPTVAASAPALIVAVQRGIQGQRLPEDEFIFQSAVDTQALAQLLSHGGASILTTSIDIGTLPWRNPIPDGPASIFTVAEVYTFLENYLRALQSGDVAGATEAHRFQFKLMSATLQVEESTLQSSFVGRMTGVNPESWSLVSDRDLVLTPEGYGRYCRVEASGGGPALRRGGLASQNGLSFLLMRAVGRIWVIG